MNMVSKYLNYSTIQPVHCLPVVYLQCDLRCSNHMLTSNPKRDVCIVLLCVLRILSNILLAIIILLLYVCVSVLCTLITPPPQLHS